MRPLHEVLIEAASRRGISQSTRRSVLALTAAAPAAFGLNSVLAQVEAERGGKQKKRNQRKRNNEQNKKRNDTRNDIEILNYALTLEHLEYAFYRDALGQGGFNANDFNAFDDRDPELFDNLEDIRDHEDTHVDTLIDVIESLGGDPVEELCYDFGYDNAAEFLGVAQALENTGVQAYTGALADIRSGDLQTAGATIATVEARHAAYLNFINGDDPFPLAFDVPLTMDEVLAIAGPFIVGEQPCT